jgi:endonuclease/exonuclease/phosphatase family metal-dependent hydrolase
MKVSGFSLCILVFLFIPLIAQESKTIEVGTFNIRFFPCNEDGEMMKKYDIQMRYPPKGLPTDTTMLFNILKILDIEILGLQEIVDPVLFRAMAKRHLGNNFKFIYAPSNAWQKVGILFDASEVELVGEQTIYWEVSLDKPDRLRPALGAYFKSIPDGFDFHVVNVHLKASPRGLGEREQQYARLQEILKHLPERNEKDKDIILLGDFNNVSTKGTEEFLPVMKQADFQWLGANDTTFISGYWRPDWRKPVLKSSRIDQIFISREAIEECVSNSIKVGGFCSAGVDSISGEFPTHYQKISDHCPVFVSFKVFPDND